VSTQHLLVSLLWLIFISRSPQSLPTTAAMADTMEEGLSSPPASGGEQDTGVANAPLRCVDFTDGSFCYCLNSSFSSHLCTIQPTDSNKTPAYAPADLCDPDTDKPIFLQSHLFSSMFEEPMLLYVL
jgi:hypothetical protein